MHRAYGEKVNAAGCLRFIGSHAFQGCALLKNFALPRELSLLPTSLFYGCESLTELSMPASVRQIDRDVFFGCTALAYVSFENGELTLMPGATNGLENAELALSGVKLFWREITGPLSSQS